MTKKQNGQAVAEKTAKKNGKVEAKGRPELTGCYKKRFANVDVSANAPIRSTNLKFKEVGTMGKLKAYLVTSFDRGLSEKEVADHFDCSSARIHELVKILSIEKFQAKKAEKKIKPRAQAKPKAKVVDAGDEGAV